MADDSAHSLFFLIFFRRDWVSRWWVSAGSSFHCILFDFFSGFFLFVLLKKTISFAGVDVDHGDARFALDVAAPDEAAEAALHVPHHLRQQQIVHIQERSKEEFLDSNWLA